MCHHAEVLQSSILVAGVSSRSWQTQQRPLALAASVLSGALRCSPTCWTGPACHPMQCCMWLVHVANKHTEHCCELSTRVHGCWTQSNLMVLRPSCCNRCARDYAVFSPANDWTLMWGDQLWDVRQPRCVHRFDSFTSFATGYFHPAGDDADSGVNFDAHYSEHYLSTSQSWPAPACRPVVYKRHAPMSAPTG